MTPYHAKYFAFELTKKISSDNIQKFTSTLLNAQVDLNPHQVEAALFAFRSPLSNGAILADEVGLGKTIEAGLVIAQKWAEKRRKILIIVPSNLRKQWNQELQDKFFLPSIILESKSFNNFIKEGKLNPFDQSGIIICSYQFARKQETYVKLTKWNLVVIDEAHRLRNVYKPSNKIANSIKSSVADRPKILLTATPLQNSLLELYGLVSIIDEYSFGDLKSYKNQYLRLNDDSVYDELKSRLKPVCIRTLRRQVLEYVRYTNRIPITQEFYPTPEEQKLYELVSDYLQNEKLFALPPSQRSLMTLILRRLLASSTYAISGTLEALAGKLDNIITEQSTENNQLEETIADNFEEFDELKDEWIEDEENEDDKTYSPNEIEEIRLESGKLKDFFNLAYSIKKNSKGEVLLTALTRGFTEAEKLGANRKAIIFTESTRTQKYLFELLEQTEFAGKIVLFNGSNNDQKSKEIYNQWLTKYKGTDRVSGSKSADIRAAIIDYYRDEAEIMIATEAAAEGVNLQFCSLVVNYDLPWNPQRIEQRIGRCHRYGQKYDVVVVNFLNKSNAADQRVYQLLSEKFKLFEGVFGASDEVLGVIESGVDFEKRIASIYQNCRTEAEIQIAFDELQKSFETQIDETLNKTRQQLLENFDQEVTEKLKVNLKASREYLSKYEEWLWDLSRYFLADYAHFDNKEYSFYLKNNPFPEELIHPGPYKIGKDINDANVYRIGHPLAQRIINECKQNQTDNAEITFDYSGVPDRKITIVEPFIGKSGWLSLSLLSITSFETEEHLLFAGITDDGIELDPESAARMFTLPAQIVQSPVYESQEVLRTINQIREKLKMNIIQTNSERNSDFFDREIEKLDNWAEDKKNSLEIELKDLDKEIKLCKAEAKKILNLEEKVAMQRQIKEMERKRNELRLELFKSQDEIDNAKENLISDIEKRLKQNTILDQLFLIRWRLK
ncbi:MAG: SNF2-related protein [Ignavibacteriaceae bacterium]|nr:SNF2-related protein [Ignavibacteriaceae bacterium]